MKEIRLTQGQVALIDDEDWKIISKYKWYAAKDGYTYYALNKVSIGNRKTRTVRMHRLILGATKGQEIDHINGNGLDNRRENIKICSRSENMLNTVKNRRKPE